MQDNMLLAYASRSGTTAEIAEAAGAVLRQQGLAVEVLPVKAVTTVEPYAAVILGSGVRVGKWLPQALDFARKHETCLSAKPLAIFTVHMLNIADDDISRSGRAAYTASIREMLKPRAEAFFGGRIELARLSFMERLMTKAVKAVEADERDWEAIRQWATSLPQQLRAR